MSNDHGKSNSSLPVPGEYDLFARIDDGYTAIREALTGILASDKKELVFSAARIFRKLRGQDFYENLVDEWKNFREKGRIKEDYATAEQCQASLQEILDCLDQDTPDEIRFSFIKKLFLSIATERLSDRESPLPQQYIKIARSLSSGEVLVLLGAYRIAKSKSFSQNDMNAFSSFSAIAKESGLLHPDLVRVLQKGLVEKGLFLWRYNDEVSGTVTISTNYRLTDLGFQICRFVGNYDTELAGAETAEAGTC